MRLLKTFAGAAILSGVLSASTLALAADQAKSGDSKTAKPYPLKTCIVSGEKLDSDMGKPYVFVEKGQEIKLCCKDCLKDFQKNSAKYLKKLAESQRGEKESTSNVPAHDHSEHQH
jgi:hypothetical protein